MPVLRQVDVERETRQGDRSSGYSGGRSQRLVPLKAVLAEGEVDHQWRLQEKGVRALSAPVRGDYNSRRCCLRKEALEVFGRNERQVAGQHQQPLRTLPHGMFTRQRQRAVKARGLLRDR
jgi:hypothetical protein